jgi:hypothetical protein
VRFVYLRHLGFEIIDYFFKGITGYEVWGNVRAKQDPSKGIFASVDLVPNEIETRRSSNLPGLDEEGVCFTWIKVSFASPDVLVPVEYRSRQFLLFTSQLLEVSNMYSSRVPEVADGDVEFEIASSGTSPVHCIFNASGCTVDAVRILPRGMMG